MLQFTCQMQAQTIVGQTFDDFSVSFRDEQTGAAWSPEDGTFGCLIDQNFVFAMTLASGSPPLDNRLWLAGEAGKIVTVFPYQIAFQRLTSAARAAFPSTVSPRIRLRGTLHWPRVWVTSGERLLMLSSSAKRSTTLLPILATPSGSLMLITRLLR